MLERTHAQNTQTLLSSRIPRDTEHERYHPELEEELKECLSLIHILQSVHQQKAPGFVEIWVLFFLLKLVYKALYITERFAIRAAFVTICTYFQQNRMIV